MEKELKEGWYLCYKVSGNSNSTVRVSYYKDGFFHPVMGYALSKDKVTTCRSTPRSPKCYYKIVPIDINNVTPIAKSKESFFTRLINHLKAGKYFNNKRI